MLACCISFSASHSHNFVKTRKTTRDNTSFCRAFGTTSIKFDKLLALAPPSMSSRGLEESLSELQVGENGENKSVQNASSEGGTGDVQVSCFTEDLHDVTLHFQIVKFSKQIYAWIGCNSAKLGHMYAAATTRPNNNVSVTSILGGTSDNTGSSIARRLVLKTGLNIVVACNIPKDSPMLEATAERKLTERLATLGYFRPQDKYRN